jgi:hypothetical protein
MPSKIKKTKKTKKTKKIKKKVVWVPEKIGASYRCFNTTTEEDCGDIHESLTVCRHYCVDLNAEAAVIV